MNLSEDYTSFIRKVLKYASKIARFNFNKVSSSVKYEDSNQVLTQTDIEIGKYIISEIKNNYPDYNIIDEEAGVIDNNSEFTWVVDPIDGTSNFASGLSTYGIMIGLLHKDNPIAGGISLPFFDLIYLAEKDKGAFCNGQAITVCNEKKLLNALIVYQIDGHQENPDQTRNETKLLAEIVLNIRNLRTTSSAYDIAMVAHGKYGGILSKTSKIWDNVAQQIIIEEAGGNYTDFYGNKIDYSNPLSKSNDNFTYCAASPVLHNQLIAIINNYEFK